jgi:myo-inositol-1(or 4)-monophosphatase
VSGDASTDDGAPGALDAGERPSLLRLATEAAHRAGDLLLGILAEGEGHARLRSEASTATKSSSTDLVTRADRASEELIAGHLLGARPDDGLFGEEGSRRVARSGIEWVIDPIDGTTNFVYGYPVFAVSIAASDPDGAVAGVVHDPLRGETFGAIRGGGCFLNGEPIAPWTVSPPLAEALVATGFAYRAETRRAQGALLAGVVSNVRDVRRAGSAALDLCSVAVGRVDAYYEAGLGRWDREAGVLIATESGRLAADVEGLVDGATTLVVAPPPLLGPLRALLERAKAGS